MASPRGPSANLEQGEHLATTEQLEAVSKACGVPTAWFELDWHAAGSSETARSWQRVCET